MKPTSLNILGKVYSIQYVDKPSDVDIFKRDSLWGQVDYWTRSIRIYDDGRNSEDLLHTLLHEIIHVLTFELKLASLIIDKSKGQHNEDDIDLLALGLADVLTRNNLLTQEERP